MRTNQTRWISCLALLAAGGLAPNAGANTYTWLTNNGNTGTAANWGGTLPGAGDTGIIGGGGSAINAVMTAALAGPPAQLQLQTNGKLTIQGTIGQQNLVMMGGTLGFAANYTYSGTVSLDSNSYFNDGGNQAVLSGLIQNNGSNAGMFIKTGANRIQLSRANNTYSGGTDIQQGTLWVTQSDATGTGNVTLNAGGTLNHGGVTLTGRIIANGGTIATDANHTLNAAIGLKANTIITTGAGFAVLSGAITDEGGTPGKLIKQGTGQYTLQNTGNTYSGGTEVQAGTLVGNRTGSLGSGGVQVNNLATVYLFGVTALRGSSTVTLQSGGTARLTGSSDPITAQSGSFVSLDANNADTSNPLTIGGTVTMKIRSDAGIVQNYSGVIDGTGKLVYDGSAKTSQATSLTKVNTYQGGTDVNSGLLTIYNNGRLPDVGTVMIASGATLTYSLVSSDTIGGLAGVGLVNLGSAVVTSAEGISPGTNLLTVGTLAATGTTGRIVLGANSTNLFHLIAPGNADKVVIQGNANLTQGGTLKIDQVGANAIQDGDYVLFDLSGGTLAGSFTQLVMPDGYKGTITTNVNDIVLTTAKMTLGTVITIR